MHMRIGIDARFLGSRSKGLGRYTEQLVRNLELLPTEFEFVIFLRRENWDVWNPSTNRFTKSLADVRWYSLEEQTKLPRILHSARCDLYHFPHFNVPIRMKDPFIVTIHDLILSHFPTMKATTLGPLMYGIKHMMYQYVMHRTLDHAEKIIAISQFTKKDLQQTYHLPDDSMEVIYEGVEHITTKGTSRNDSVLEKYGLRTPYLLYVGNAYPHKNLETLIESFSLLQKKHPNLSLVLVGAHDYFYRKIIALVHTKGTQNILFPGYVEDGDLPTLYRKAALYVFPSKYEGFGLPPLEAMAHGVPVVSSNASCLPEILGDAAVYFSPSHPHDIVHVIESTLQNDALRERLVQRGMKRIERYSWKTMAEKVLALYKELLQSYA